MLQKYQTQAHNRLKQRHIDVDTTLFRRDLFQWLSLSTFGNTGFSRLIKALSHYNV